MGEIAEKAKTLLKGRKFFGSIAPVSYTFEEDGSMEIRGLQEEMPPYMRLESDCAKFSKDGIKYDAVKYTESPDVDSLKIFRMLDPRTVLDVARVLREDNKEIRLALDLTKLSSTGQGLGESVERLVTIELDDRGFPALLTTQEPAMDGFTTVIFRY